MNFVIPSDLTLEKEFIVEEKHSPKHLGTGSVAVLSTPSMIMFMEHVSRICVDEPLPEDFTTVGTEVSVKHLAAAPIGAKIRVKCQLSTHVKRRLSFKVEVWWKTDKLGEGLHERFIINQKRFTNRLKEKMEL